LPSFCIAFIVALARLMPPSWQALVTGLSRFTAMVQLLPSEAGRPLP
jgi:hypothetical protein